jgi:hypothetical protein
MIKYTVSSIDYFHCKEWLLYKHYAKRMCPIEYSFGLFDENKVMQGVITFGTPVSSTLRDLWKGEYKLMELNRLVTSDGLPKNTLSYFVSTALKLLPNPLVVVSYADTEQNHNGYIYQATNFIYTGLSAKRTDWKIKGMDHLHGGTIADISRGKSNRAEYLKEKFGNDFYYQERSRKHRYFYFLGNKRDKKSMLKMLPYEIEPYPKGENKRYDSSYNPVTQTTLF